jgi:SOS-response transcriptional repressor LexA
MAENQQSVKTKFVRLAGDVSQGAAIDRTSSSERVLVPTSKIDVGEIILRARDDIDGSDIEAGDLLIVECREPGHAATGEFVVVLIADRAFIGHWWEKKGERALMDDKLHTITEDRTMRILGAITVIVRMR